jgi:C-terminus of AA_permease
MITFSPFQGLEKHSPATVVLSGLLFVLTMVLLVVVARQPRVHTTEGNFEVPLGPWLPALSVFLHVLLLMQLLFSSWLSFLAVITSGNTSKITTAWI